MIEVKITKDNIDSLIVGDVIKFHNGYEWRTRIINDFILERHFFQQELGMKPVTY